MNFWQAVASGFSNYVKFSGRASRSEYWYWVLFVSIVGVVATLLDGAIVHHRHGPIARLWELVTVLPGLALAVRRLHDTSHGGWWLLVIGGLMAVMALILFAFGLVVVPVTAMLIGLATLIFLFCQPGTPGANKFGPDPFGPLGHVSQRSTA